MDYKYPIDYFISMFTDEFKGRILNKRFDYMRRMIKNLDRVLVEIAEPGDFNQKDYEVKEQIGHLFFLGTLFGVKIFSRCLTLLK